MVFTHWGYFCSRPISKQSDLQHQCVYPLDASHPIKRFSELSSVSQQEIQSVLTKSEQEKRFVVEGMFRLNLKEDRIEKRYMRKAKVDPLYYPELVMKLIDDGIITEKEVFQNIEMDYIDSWYSTRLKDSPDKDKVVLVGESISRGIAVGRALFERDKVKKELSNGERVIWITESVLPDDLELLLKVQGIILTQAGASSHASILMKSLDLPFILSKNEDVIDSGSEITVDANSGVVYSGAMEFTNSKKNIYLDKLTELAKKFSKIKVNANANNVDELLKANSYGGQGIALCRTEHMFLESDRINLIRDLILNRLDESSSEVEEVINKQRQDLHEIFKNLNGNSIVIRFLDLPLYELMPNSESELQKYSKHLGLDKDIVATEVSKFSESNSMMGNRGARFLINNNFFIRLQAKAILLAVKDLLDKGESIRIGFELPLVSTVEEFVRFKAIVHEEIDEVLPEFKNYFFAVMIETPRACLISQELARHVDLVCFGTNDLTQFTYAFSRDDVYSFLGKYMEDGVIDKNPFEVLDVKGVGNLIKKCVQDVRKVNPDIEISICGEQATDYDSIDFLLDMGIDEIGCSAQSIPRTLFASAKLSIHD